MGRTRLYPIRHVGMERNLISGSFITVGSGNPTVVYGEGFTVVRNGAGDYDVTLTDAAQRIETVVAMVHTKTEATGLHVYGDIDTLTTSLVTLTVNNSSDSPADDVGSRVDFIIIAKDTSVNDAR